MAVEPTGKAEAISRFDAEQTFSSATDHPKNRRFGSHRGHLHHYGNIVQGSGERTDPGHEGRSSHHRAVRTEYGSCDHAFLLSIQRFYGTDEITVMVFPSDHLIEPQDAFVTTLQSAVSCAKEGHIVAIGITPTYPETGFGYLKANSTGYVACPVDRFVEKPDKETAERYLADGTYFWNAGIFVFTLSVMERELKTFVPDIYHMVGTMVDEGTINETTYGRVPSISIDYAVMEKSDAVEMVPARFSWDDVGSFLALTRHFQQDESQNTVIGEKKQVVLSLSHNNIIDVQNSPRNKLFSSASTNAPSSKATERCLYARTRTSLKSKSSSNNERRT